jgi:hypothetical protein
MNKELKKLMKKNNFYLLREKKHLVWQHKSGGIVTTSRTPSCHRAFKNIVKNITEITGGALI